MLKFCRITVENYVLLCGIGFVYIRVVFLCFTLLHFFSVSSHLFYTLFFTFLYSFEMVFSLKFILLLLIDLNIFLGYKRQA